MILSYTEIYEIQDDNIWWSIHFECLLDLLEYSEIN